MTQKQQKTRLSELLSEAFIRVSDNFGMPNSDEVADYLLANGVSVEYMRSGDPVYQLTIEHKCKDPEGFDCGRCGENMKYLSTSKCIHHSIEFGVAEVAYNPKDQSQIWGRTIFKTKEDAQEAMMETTELHRSNM